MCHQSSFDITTAEKFFDYIVKPQYEDFVEKNSSQRHALLTTIVAYHMYEWVHNTKFRKPDFENIYKDHPKSQELAKTFELARLLTNGTKHFGSPVETRTQTGFSSAFSDAFTRPLIVKYPNNIIEDSDSAEESADIFLRKMIDFWEEQKNDNFPYRNHT